MKLLSNRVDRSGHGYMSFIPEEGEDLWHVYNLITAGDVVRCTTLRKVVTESSTGWLLFLLSLSMLQSTFVAYFNSEFES